MPRDIVYLVGPGEANESLRYSLRSLANLPHGRVWIVGHCPAWVEGVQFLPLAQRGPKHANTWASLEYLGKKGPEDFYLFNDDYFVLEPQTAVPVFHRGSLQERVAYYDRKPGLRAWAQRGRHTLEAFRRLDFDLSSLRSYELHLPIPLRRSELAGAVEMLHQVRVLDPQFYMKRTWVANWANLGGASRADCKVHSKWGNATLRGDFLSTSDPAWSGSTGAALRVRFPEPSPYERTAPTLRGMNAYSSSSRHR